MLTLFTSIFLTTSWVTCQICEYFKLYFIFVKTIQNFELTITKGTSRSLISDDLRVAMKFRQNPRLIHILVAEF